MSTEVKQMEDVFKMFDWTFKRLNKLVETLKICPKCGSNYVKTIDLIYVDGDFMDCGCFAIYNNLSELEPGKYECECGQRFFVTPEYLTDEYFGNHPIGRMIIK